MVSKEASARYKKSAKGKAAAKRYRESDAGKKAQALARARFKAKSKTSRFR
jgi:hypothetical protein